MTELYSMDMPLFVNQNGEKVWASFKEDPTEGVTVSFYVYRGKDKLRLGHDTVNTQKLIPETDYYVLNRLARIKYTHMLWLAINNERQKLVEINDRILRLTKLFEAQV